MAHPIVCSMEQAQGASLTTFPTYKGWAPAATMLHCIPTAGHGLANFHKAFSVLSLPTPRDFRVIMIWVDLKAICSRPAPESQDPKFQPVGKAVTRRCQRDLLKFPH